MSKVSEQLRRQIVARAGNRCEYCRFPADGQVGRFPIDHVVPRNEGGASTLENLALACPACNGHKWAHTKGVDPETGEQCALFNPRSQPWFDHFQWAEREHVELVGRTAIGRATIAQLQMNSPEMLLLRRLLATLGHRLA